MAPLTAMFKADFDWEWTAVHQAAFDKLKQAMIDATHLSAIAPQQPYHLYTEASKDCVGATLAQRCAHGKYKGHLRPIAFLSQKMLSAETRYPIREQKLLAIVLALKQWFHVLRGPQQVHVHTDHESLRYLKRCPRPLTPRQARRSQFLQEYNLTLWYVAGLENPAADTCSGLTSRQLMDIENTTSTRAFVVPLVENGVSPEGETVYEFLYVLEDSFSHDEVWPQPNDHLYVSLRSGRSLGKEPDVDGDAEPALQFDTETAVEPEKLEPLPSNEALAEACPFMYSNRQLASNGVNPVIVTAFLHLVHLIDWHCGSRHVAQKHLITAEISFTDLPLKLRQLTICTQSPCRCTPHL